MVLACKTRDMIYVQALVSDKILMKEQEKAEDASDSRINPRYSANDFITNQSNTQQAGPLGLLFSNTFRVSSPYSISGKPSIFNSDAILFRRVLVELFADPSPWEQTRDLGVALVSVWQNQIRALAPMINLQYLKLTVLGLLDVDWGLRRCGVLRYMLLEGVAAHYLKPELLTILPAAIREGTSSRDRGTWVTWAQPSCLGRDACIF